MMQREKKVDIKDDWARREARRAITKFLEYYREYTGREP